MMENEKKERIKSAREAKNTVEKAKLE